MLFMSLPFAMFYLCLCPIMPDFARPMKPTLTVRLATCSAACSTRLPRFSVQFPWSFILIFTTLTVICYPLSLQPDTRTIATFFYFHSSQINLTTFVSEAFRFFWNLLPSAHFVCHLFGKLLFRPCDPHSTLSCVPAWAHSQALTRSSCSRFPSSRIPASSSPFALFRVCFWCSFCPESLWCVVFRSIWM